MLKLFLCLTFFLVSLAHGVPTPFEANLIDEVIAHHRDGDEASELAFKRSSNLDVKRLARKLLRENHRDTKKLQSWRENYYKGIAERWIPASNIFVGLGSLNGGEFDRAYIERMRRHYLKGQQQLRRAQQSSSGFIDSFVDGSLKHYEKNLEEMKKVQTELEGN